MRVLMRVIGIMLGAAALAGMAWVSRAPLGLASGNNAVVRVSLGARPERIESCTTQSDEELAKLAPQMRQRVICEGVTARYRLELRRGSDVLLSRIVRGGGLRHDRQLYVFREIPVPAGHSSLHLRLTRIDTITATAGRDEDDERNDQDERRREDGRREHDERQEQDERAGERDIMSGRDTRDREERQRRRDQAVPAELELDVDETLSPGDVLLLTYDPATRTLRAVRRVTPSA